MVPVNKIDGWTWCDFHILTSKCAFHQNGVHLSASVCFSHFEFQVCLDVLSITAMYIFSKELRSCCLDTFSTCWYILTFWLQKNVSHSSGVHICHINFQKCSKNDLLFSFGLWNVLCTIAAYNFWSLIRQDGLLSDLLEPQNSGKLAFRPLWYSFFLPSVPWLCLFFDLLSTDSFPSLTVLNTVAASVHESELSLLNFPRSQYVN